jgi:hypothetical protein
MLWLAGLSKQGFTMKPSFRAKICGTLILVAALTATSLAHAEDETAAIYVQGMGGSMSNNASQSVGGLGWQAGAQLLIFEAYLNQTAFANGSSVTRAVFGPYFDVTLGHWELSLHLGVGAIRDSGGALYGDSSEGPHNGAVARIVVALERDLGTFFVIGASLDSEAFSSKSMNYGTGSQWQDGSSVFLSGHLKFELGI